MSAANFPKRDDWPALCKYYLPRSKPKPKLLPCTSVSVIRGESRRFNDEQVTLKVVTTGQLQRDLRRRSAREFVSPLQKQGWQFRTAVTANPINQLTGDQKMKNVSFCLRILLGTLLLASVAQADLLTTFTTSIAANDPTQLGRLSRSGIPSDWSSVKAFPGVINPTTTYNYHTYTVNSGVTPYIYITIDSVPANTFASTYLPSYDPTNKALNYIGDAGSSGNYFGVDPVSFEVYVPIHTNFLILVNTSSNAGIGQPFTITVQGFIDDQFTPTPEPGTLVLLGSGMLGVVGLVRRKLNLG